MKQNRKKKGILILLPILLAAGLGLLIWNQTRLQSEQREEQSAYSEEQAAERLRTLEEALQTTAAEVVPMQFFEEELRADNGTFSLVAVTTMPEDDIEEVSFLATSDSDITKYHWYEAEKEGPGYYHLNGSLADLGNRSGRYTVKAYITPRGGSETEAGSTTIKVSLQNYLYSEALGEGVQSVVLVDPEIESEEELEKVEFKVWSKRGGQEDITTIAAEEIEKGVWEGKVSLEEFDNKGGFMVNAYAVAGGEELGVASGEFELLPDPIEVPEGEMEAEKKGTAVYVDVPDVLQNPELPTGCESVALTIVLNAMGYPLEKTEIARNYLERGDNFAISYVGDPFSQNGAGCFPPAIVQTADKYLKEQEDERRGHNLTGRTLDDLCQYIDNGIPVLVWTSMYMMEPQFTGAVVTYHGQKYEWYRSEHCVVLYGYDETKNTYLISDPLVGYVERDQAAFERIYEMTGACAVAIY